MQTPNGTLFTIRSYEEKARWGFFWAVVVARGKTLALPTSTWGGRNHIKNSMWKKVGKKILGAKNNFLKKWVWRGRKKGKRDGRQKEIFFRNQLDKKDGSTTGEEWKKWEGSCQPKRGLSG